MHSDRKRAWLKEIVTTLILNYNSSYPAQVGIG